MQLVANAARLSAASQELQALSSLTRIATKLCDLQILVLLALSFCALGVRPLIELHSAWAITAPSASPCSASNTSMRARIGPLMRDLGFSAFISVCISSTTSLATRRQGRQLMT